MNNPLFQNGNDSGREIPLKIIAQKSGSGKGQSVPQSPYGDELKMLLDGFLETIVRSLGASGGVVRVVSPNGDELHVAGSAGLPAGVLEQENRVELECGVCGKAASDGNIHEVDGASCAWRSATGYFGGDCHRVMAVPLNSRGRLVGIFNLFFKSGQEVASEDMSVLRSFAELIGISLENARLARENRRMNIMSERQAIANEIHDSLAQTLVYSRMRMSMLQDALGRQELELAGKCAHDVNEALEYGQKSVRELITNFRCQMDPLGLQHALQVLVDGFRERSGIELDYTNNVPDSGLPSEHELQVYHIVSEVLANIAAHSGATHARLTADLVDGRYEFTVEDNGMGIRDNADMEEGHYGLTIMRERAQRIGAELEVESREGRGTCVRLGFSAS